MGLGTSSNTTFLSIGDGKITRRVKSPTTKSRERTLKNGNTIHEEIYDYIEGFITDIKVYQHEQYGKFWNVYMTDDTGETYCLQMNYSGGYSSAFLKILPNVDIKEKVKISPTMKVIDGKKKVGLFINQDGHALKHFYTKDNPNDLPQMRKVRVKGQDVWDDTDMMEFLESMVKTDIIPKITYKSGGQAGRVNAPAPVNDLPVTGEDDDPPF